MSYQLTDLGKSLSISIVLSTGPGPGPGPTWCRHVCRCINKQAPSPCKKKENDTRRQCMEAVQQHASLVCLAPPPMTIQPGVQSRRVVPLPPRRRQAIGRNLLASTAGVIHSVGAFANCAASFSPSNPNHSSHTSTPNRSATRTPLKIIYTHRERDTSALLMLRTHAAEGRPISRSFLFCFVVVNLSGSSSF